MMLQFKTVENPHIYVFGTGGTGGFALEYLTRLYAESSQRVTIELYDGDDVEAKNLKRQNFTVNDLDMNKAEALVKKVLAGDNVIEQIEQVKEAKMYLNDVQERLKQILGTNVNIKQGKKKSRIEIEFYNDDDLARLVELLMEKQESPQMNKSRIIKDFNI